MSFARTFMVFWLAVVVTVQQAEAGGPEAFVREFVDRAVVLATTEAMPVSERRRQFDSLVHETVDLGMIGPSLMGPYWTLANPRQRRAFVEAVTYLVPGIYMDYLHLYLGQSIVVDGHQQDGARSVVNSRIVSIDGRPDIQLDWRVDRRVGRFKVVDACIDGKSTNELLRLEYMSVIGRNDGQVDALIDWLDRQLAMDRHGEY